MKKESTPDEIEAPQLTLEQEDTPDELCSVINLIVVLVVVIISSIIFGVSDEIKALCGF